MLTVHITDTSWPFVIVDFCIYITVFYLIHDQDPDPVLIVLSLSPPASRMTLVSVFLNPGTGLRIVPMFG